MRQVRPLEANELSAWDDLVAHSPFSSIWDERPLLEPLGEATGDRLQYWGVFDGTELVAGAAFGIRSRWGLRMAVPLRLTYCNTLLVRGTSNEQGVRWHHRIMEITECFARELRRRFSLCTVTHHPGRPDMRGFWWAGWRCRVLHTYLIDLPSYSERQMSRSKRRAVRQAQRAGLQVDLSPSAAEVCRLLELTHQRQGIPNPLPLPWLEHLERALPDCLAKLVVREPTQNRPVAAGISILDDPRGRVYGWFAGFDPNFQNLRASAFLQWAEIQEWKRRGFRVLDLIGADIKSNACFKAEFGAQLAPYYQASYASLPFRVARRVFSM